MKLKMLLLSMAVVCSAYADGTNGHKKVSAMIKATGGWITRTTEGTKILLADARKAASELESIRHEMQAMCNIPVAVDRAECDNRSTPYAKARSLLSDDVGLVVFLHEGALDEPLLATYPESRVAVVNVTPMMDRIDRKKGLARVERELWRALVYLAGGVLSTMPSVMRPVFSPADLDGIECRTASPIEANMINTTAKSFGLARIQRTTYRAALRQGWAPAPTNEYQRAIWEKVKADKERGPTNPITIKPPKK